MKNKIVKIFLLIIIIFPCLSISAFAFKAFEVQDTIKDHSKWTVELGYFPNYSNSYTSDGVSLLLLNESIFIKEINHGYYFALRKALNNKLNTNLPNGGFSLAAYLNFPVNLNNNPLIFRSGIGFGYPTAALNFLYIIMIEYAIPINDNTSFSFSILQEIVRFNYLLPVQINIGIRF